MHTQWIENENGTFSVITHGDGGTRPEPTQAEREAARLADRIHGKKLRQQFRCSDAEYDAIVNDPTFPRVLGYVTSSVFQRTDTVFSKTQVNTWLERQHARAAALPKTVK